MCSSAREVPAGHAGFEVECCGACPRPRSRTVGDVNRLGLVFDVVMWSLELDEPEVIVMPCEVVVMGCDGDADRFVGRRTTRAGGDGSATR